MTLKEFIKKLKKITKEYGGSAQIVMADNILVVDPVYVENYNQHKKVVVITDQE